MPGQSIVLDDIFEIGPPAGLEIFKLVASDQPLNLGEVIQTRGSAVTGNNNGEQNPFESLIGMSYFNEDCMTRGGSTQNVPAHQVNIYSFNFIIE
jgi:hypothetical protein